MVRVKIFGIVFAAVVAANLVCAILAPRPAQAGIGSISESAERMAKALERIANVLEKPKTP
jgi:hypothetical protein